MDHHGVPCWKEPGTCDPEAAAFCGVLPGRGWQGANMPGMESPRVHDSAMVAGMMAADSKGWPPLRNLPFRRYLLRRDGGHGGGTGRQNRAARW